MSIQVSRRTILAGAAGAAAAGLGLARPALAGARTVHRLAGPLSLTPGDEWPDPIVARALAVFKPGFIYSQGPPSHSLNILDAEGDIAGMTPLQPVPPGNSGYAVVLVEYLVFQDGSVRFVSRGTSGPPVLVSAGGFGGLILSSDAASGGDQFLAGALMISEPNEDRTLTHVLPFEPAQAGGGGGKVSMNDLAWWGPFVVDPDPTRINVLLPPRENTARAASLALLNSAGDYVLPPYTLEPAQRSRIMTLTVTFDTTVSVREGRDLLIGGQTADDRLMIGILIPATLRRVSIGTASGAQGGTIQSHGALRNLSGSNW